jgi:hypothetical protein
MPKNKPYWFLEHNKEKDTYWYQKENQRKPHQVTKAEYYKLRKQRITSGH